MEFLWERWSVWSIAVIVAILIDDLIKNERARMIIFWIIFGMLIATIMENLGYPLLG